jgi:DNA-directed RNA polymerase subunit RPC12/RpoP
MIHEGERNREEKIKLIDELNESIKKNDIRLFKKRTILFVCSQCGLQISFEPKSRNDKSDRMDFDYDNYKILFKDKPDYKPFENNYKNTDRGYWGGATSYICLDCASGFSSEKENTENNCENCGSKNVILGKELGGKPCPICGTALNDGIKLQGFETFWAKRHELKNEWWDIYRERYNVKKQISPNYSKEEIKEQERRNNLIKCYDEDDYYVMDNPHNVIRFVFRDAWMSGFCCILEWDDNINGKITLFKGFKDVWIEKNIEYKMIEQVINLLKDYNFFDRNIFKVKRSIKIDGHTFGMEVKYGKKYKELALWGIEDGILYDVGMLLIQFADKTFKELYEYAW